MSDSGAIGRTKEVLNIDPQLLSLLRGKYLRLCSAGEHTTEKFSEWLKAKMVALHTRSKDERPLLDWCRDKLFEHAMHKKRRSERMPDKDREVLFPGPPGCDVDASLIADEEE